MKETRYKSIHIVLLYLYKFPENENICSDRKQMGSYPGREEEIAKGCEEMVGIDENAHFLDSDDSFIAYICVKIHEMAHLE